MVDAEKIIAEIRWLKTELQGYSAREALDYIESYINLQERYRFLHLDEAAEEYLKQYNESEFGNGGDDWDDDIIITFKAGAKWMSGLGKIFDGEVISTSDNNWECIRIYEKIHSVGDKVIVQIRKKED